MLASCARADPVARASACTSTPSGAAKRRSYMRAARAAARPCSRRRSSSSGESGPGSLATSKTLAVGNGSQRGRLALHGAPGSGRTGRSRQDGLVAQNASYGLTAASGGDQWPRAPRRCVEAVLRDRSDPRTVAAIRQEEAPSGRGGEVTSDAAPTIPAIRCSSVSVQRAQVGPTDTQPRAAGRRREQTSREPVAEAVETVESSALTSGAGDPHHASESEHSPFFGRARGGPGAPARSVGSGGHLKPAARFVARGGNPRDR